MQLALLCLGLQLAVSSATLQAQQLVFLEIAPLAGGFMPDMRNPIMLEDLDGDGRLDLVATQASDVLVFANREGGFTRPQRFGAGARTLVNYGLVAADIDGDGRPDIAATTNDGFVVLINTTPVAAPALSFAPPIHVASIEPFYLAAADLNGDGRPDLVASDNFGLKIFINSTIPGAGAPSFRPVQPLPDVATLFVALADFNTDGRPDLVVGQTARLRLWLNETVPAAEVVEFADPVALPTGFTPGYLAVADLNADGRPDIAVGSTQLPERVLAFVNSTLSGASAAQFGSGQVLGLASKASPFVRAADMDGDGLVDLVLGNDCCNESDTLMTQVNHTSPGSPTLGFHPPQFIEQRPDLATATPMDMQLGDVDGDGRVDVLSRSGLGVRILLNVTRGDVIFNNGFD